MNKSQPLAVDDPQRLGQQLSDTAEQCLALARREGATASELGVSASSGLSVTARMREVETVEHIRDKGIGLTVYVGQRKGTATCSDFSPDAIADTVRAALAIARHTGEDECSGLGDADRMATDLPDLDLYHPWALEPEDAVTLALAIEAAALDHDSRISNSDGATVGTHATSHVYANSHGFVGLRHSTRHSISCVCIAENEAGMQRDYWYDSARAHTDMRPGAEIGAEAARRTLRRLSPGQVKTGEYPVLLPPEVASSLFGHFIGAIRGPNLYRDASFLVGHRGKQVFAEHIRLHEQPHLPHAAGSASYDGEGVATIARDLVTDGVLQGYVLDSYAGRKLGLPSTGNAGGVHNLTVEPGTEDLEALCKRMGSGVLISDLMGMGVSIITGDYSRGASGFWVENGVIAHPIKEFTIAGQLADIFLNIVAVGSDTDTRGNTRTGSVLLSPMTVAGR